MNTVNDWVKVAALKIARRFDYDRADLFHIEKILREECPFKEGVAYARVDSPEHEEKWKDLGRPCSGYKSTTLGGSCTECGQTAADHLNVVVTAAEHNDAIKALFETFKVPLTLGQRKSVITILAGIVGHAHAIDVAGNLTCGCQWPEGSETKLAEVLK